jgi:hypothetical protein
MAPYMDFPRRHSGEILRQFATTLPIHVANSRKWDIFFAAAKRASLRTILKTRQIPAKTLNFLREIGKVLASSFIPFQNGTTIAGRFSIFYAALSIVEVEILKRNFEPISGFNRSS